MMEEALTRCHQFFIFRCTDASEDCVGCSALMLLGESFLPKFVSSLLCGLQCLHATWRVLFPTWSHWVQNLMSLYFWRFIVIAGLFSLGLEQCHRALPLQWQASGLVAGALRIVCQNGALAGGLAGGLARLFAMSAYHSCALL